MTPATSQDAGAAFSAERHTRVANVLPTAAAGIFFCLQQICSAFTYHASSYQHWRGMVNRRMGWSEGGGKRRLRDTAIHSFIEHGNTWDGGQTAMGPARTSRTTTDTSHTQSDRLFALPSCAGAWLLLHRTFISHLLLPASLTACDNMYSLTTACLSFASPAPPRHIAIRILKRRLPAIYAIHRRRQDARRHSILSALVTGRVRHDGSSYVLLLTLSLTIIIVPTPKS